MPERIQPRERLTRWRRGVGAAGPVPRARAGYGVARQRPRHDRREPGDHEAEQRDHADDVAPAGVGRVEHPEADDEQHDREPRGGRGVTQREAARACRRRARSPRRAPRNVIVNSSASDGNSSTPPAITATTTVTSVSWEAAAWSIVSPGSSTGLRAIAQAAITAATAIAPVTRAGSNTPRPDQPERDQPGHDGHDHRRQRAAVDEARVERVRVGVDDDQRGDRDGAGDAAGDQRPDPERVGDLALAGAVGVGGEEDRGHVDREADRQRADHQRHRRQPAGERRAGGVADRDPLGRDRAGGAARARTG